MNHDMSRRTFLRSSTLAATSLSTSSVIAAMAQQKHEKEPRPSPVKLGLASYTFRNFNRSQMIGYMKQLNLSALKAGPYRLWIRRQSRSWRDFPLDIK